MGSLSTRDLSTLGLSMFIEAAGELRTASKATNAKVLMVSSCLFYFLDLIIISIKIWDFYTALK